MVGFEVTPLMPSSSTRRCRIPSSSSPRLMLSIQTAWPSASISRSRFVMSSSVLSGGHWELSAGLPGRVLSIRLRTGRGRLLHYRLVPRVLVCDDAPGFRLMLGLTLRDAGWEVEEADSYVTALARVRETRFDVVL